MKVWNSRSFARFRTILRVGRRGKQMKRLVFPIVIVLMSVTVDAQTTATVQGQLKDAGRELANTTVQLVSPDRTFTATTDAHGDYRIDAVPDGRYVLSSGRLRLNVFVHGGHIDISEVSGSVTISAGELQSVEEVSKTVDTITGQEMRDRADFALVESLRTIPGFRVQQSGGFGRVASIKTRGLRNQDTALLIDGARFRDVSAITGDATPFLSDFTLTSVSEIEVLRGSGSSLYGTNAIGGVIDLQTPTAASGTHGQISGAVGGLGLRRFRGNLSHGRPSGKFGVTSALSRTVYTKGLDGQDDAHNTNLQMRIDAAPSRRTSLSGRLFFSDADVRLNANPDTMGALPPTNATIISAKPYVNFTPDANDPDSLQRSRFFSSQILGNRVISSNWTLSGYYHGLKTKRTNENGPLGPGFQSASTSVFDGRILTINAHLTWSSERNTVTSGYEFERERFGNIGRTPSGTGNFSTEARQRSNTVYAQDLVSLADGRLQLAGGLRVQGYRLARPAFSLTGAPYTNLSLENPPNAVTLDGAASYLVRRTATKFRAHVGNGYRVPSLYERFGTFFSSFGTPSFVALGDPYLRPERSIAFDAGIEQTAAAERVRVSATYFYTRLRDIIGFGNVVPNIGSTTRPFGGYENQKGGIARGGEFSLKAKATDSTDIFTSYTYTNSDQRTPQVSGSRILTTLGVPEHQFTLVATQRVGHFWINFDFLATSSYLAPIFSNTSFNTYVYRFEGNRRGDLTAGYTFRVGDRQKTIRVYGTVENIFKQEYYENGFRTVGAKGRIGLTFGF